MPCYYPYTGWNELTLLWFTVILIFVLFAVALLFVYRSVQEVKAKIDRIESRITAMENRLNELTKILEEI
jgi:cell division protein FtsL